jgi:hypothetical protein
MTEKVSNLRKHHEASFYKRPGTIVCAALLVIIGGLLAFWFILPQGERINHSGYQVVYMVSGQAYFGKLKNASGEYLTLHEPYTAQDVTPKEQAAPDEQQPSTTLLKVSQQQYGPQDVISLKSDQVLFWQNLRSDSKVIQAINEAK